MNDNTQFGASFGHIAVQFFPAVGTDPRFKTYRGFVNLPAPWQKPDAPSLVVDSTFRMEWAAVPTIKLVRRDTKEHVATLQFKRKPSVGETVVDGSLTIKVSETEKPHVIQCKFTGSGNGFDVRFPGKARATQFKRIAA